MLEKIHIRNSTLLLIGIVFVSVGLLIGFSDYIKARKDKTFSEMNILLYESEMPQTIESDIEIKERQDIDNKENEEVPEEPSENTKSEEPSYNYIGILEIPKLNLRRGFLDLNSRYNNVDYNVTLIKGSTFPDEENNNLILAAHSGPCSYCYFNKLYKLSLGDVAYITYKGVKHSYKIVNIYEVEKDGTVTIYRDYEKSVLTLITCTRGSNTKQTVYILEEY